MESLYDKSINYVENTSRMKKFRKFQQGRPWAKVKYLSAAYVLWWGLKLTAISYAPTLIDVFDNSSNGFQGELETIVDRSDKHDKKEDFDDEDFIKVKFYSLPSYDSSNLRE